MFVFIADLLKLLFMFLFYRTSLAFVLQGIRQNPYLYNVDYIINRQRKQELYSFLIIKSLYHSHVTASSLQKCRYTKINFSKSFLKALSAVILSVALPRFRFAILLAQNFDSVLRTTLKMTAAGRSRNA